MLVYKVFYKDFQLKKGELIGLLVERRKNARGMNLAESGLGKADVWQDGKKWKTDLCCAE